MVDFVPITSLIAAASTIGTPYTANVVLTTNAAGNIFPNSNIFVDVAGEVGIGVGTPLSKLDVNGGVGIRGTLNASGAASFASLTSNGAVSGTTFTGTSFIPTGATVPANGMYLSAANTVSIATASTESVRISPLGNVSVGSPGNPSGSSATLLVRGIGTNPGGVQIHNGGSGGGQISGIIGNAPALAFSTYTGAIGSEVYTERMRLASDGNLAIGTTTSTLAKVTIQGVAGANTVGELYMSDGTQWTRLGSNFNTSAYNGIVATSDHGMIYSNGTANTGAFVIAPWSTGTSGMRFDANGNVSIGQGSVTAGYELDVGGSVRVVGGIVATGEITAYFSDQRLKANITAITNAVDKVMAINGVYYNANDLAVEIAGEDKTIQRVGLLAQEVEEILPQIVKAAPFDIGDNGVSKSGEHYKTVQYERVVPLLVEAIKEQQQQIADLQKRVSQLENTDAR